MSQSTATALVEYEHPQPLPAELIQKVANRNAIADSFVAKSNVGYYGIRSGIKLDSLWDRIQNTNLIVDTSMRAESLLEELQQRSEKYFRFTIDLFKFYHRPNGTLRNILKAPLTHAELEEENIEQKFPDDVQARALMRALVLVIERNQKKHIFHKACLQIAFTIPAMLMAISWSGNLYVFFFNLILSLGDIDFSLHWKLLISVVTAIGFTAVYLWVIRHILTFCLKVIADLFKQANTASCDRATTDLTTLNAKISREFDKLIQHDIATSQANYKVVYQDDWPERAEKVFKVALWTARRIEHLEKFWQIQFERLRIFAMVSHWIDGLISIAISFAFAFIALIGIRILSDRVDQYYYLHDAAIFVIFCMSAWRISTFPRKTEFSFSVSDILSQQFSKWAPFSSLRYYDIIANQFRNDKAEYQKSLKSRTTT